MEKRKQLGQFFTTNTHVQNIMGGLIRNREGVALEPSCGAGDLVLTLEEHPFKKIVAVEYDTTQKSKSQKVATLYEDFFVYSSHIQHKFDTVFGNPPYVAWKNCTAETHKSAERIKTSYTSKVNLSVLFMHESINLLNPNGELIFIVPKEWFFATAAEPLREKFSAEGRFTHIIDCGEEKLFPDASVPSLLIFRWQKNDSTNILPHSSPYLLKYARTVSEAENNMYEDRYLMLTGQHNYLHVSPLLFPLISQWGTLGDYYEPKVGLVSGLDQVYKLDERTVRQVDESSVQFQVDTTRMRIPFLNVNDATGWEDIPASTKQYLMSHKKELLGRRIARFDETNWWKYGAVRNQEIMCSDRERFYAFAKTRSGEPFFKGEPGESFTGALVGLFAQENQPEGSLSLNSTVTLLNSAEYRKIFEGLMLVSGGRLSLHQRTLSDLPFPKNVTQLEQFYSIDK